MKSIILLVLLSTSIQALPLREHNPVTLRLGKWVFRENSGHYKKVRNIIKVCHDSVLKEDQIIFKDCPHKVSLKTIGHQAFFDVKLKDTSLQANLTFHFNQQKDEIFYGAGTQYTHLSLNGKKIEFLSQEQGNGRGIQPLSFFQELLLPGLSGSEQTTYATSPIILSSTYYALILDSDNYATASFDKTHHFDLTVYDKKFSLHYFKSRNWYYQLKNISTVTGRMRVLPSWIQQGAIIGLMGGEKSVRKKLELIKKSKTEIAGVWTQDWVGVRETFLGTRLKWDWQKDEKSYPSLDFGYPTLTYFNPYMTEIPNSKNRVSQLKEAKKKNFLLKIDNKYVLSNQGGFHAYLIDLFNPKAYLWLKEKMKIAIRKHNVKGWMADFSENYPITEFGGQHHRYIEKWIKLNYEIVEEIDPENLTFFNRASHLKVPGFSTLYWLGDQTSTWDKNDGLHSSLIGLLSSGLSGKVFNHSDIGGYVSLKIFPFVNIKRSKELLLRWMELNAFTALFRTHPGLNPELAVQVYHDKETLQAFSKWSRVYKALYEYKKPFIQLASDFGWPLIRPLFLNYPQDKKVPLIDDQFLLGDHLMVAPILKEKATKRSVYLPKGYWTDLWTNRVYMSKGKYVEVSAPLGKPPVFVTPKFKKELLNNIRSIR
jgi:alpha-glucosidase